MAEAGDSDKLVRYVSECPMPLEMLSRGTSQADENTLQAGSEVSALVAGLVKLVQRPKTFDPLRLPMLLSLAVSSSSRPLLSSSGHILGRRILQRRKAALSLWAIDR